MSGQRAGGARHSGPGREFRHLDDVLDFVDGIREESRRTVQRYEQYVAQVGELTGEGFSPDGAVRVVVDGGGAVAGVDIADSALRHRGRLAMLVLGAIHQAQAARALKVAELGDALGVCRTTGMVREAVPDHVRDAIERRDADR